MRRRARMSWAAAAVALAWAAVACGSGGAPGGADAGAADALRPADGEGDAGAVGETAGPCPTGHVPDPEGGCMPAGIQGCAAVFLQEDGLCHPRAAKCPAGTIPKFDEGCVSVGIPGCAALFLEEDGLCHPRMEKCPAGTIPQFDEGCVPVGIPGCAALFLEEDGLCHPRIEKCPAGTIPRFDEGCVPVGIRGCAAVFVQEDGTCRPRSALCPAGTVAAPTEGCVPLDGPDGCGDGTWGAVAEAPDTMYVDPAAPDDAGDGSRARPARTIAQALAAVPEGGRVVLAAGTYDEPLVVTRSVQVVGRCASLVTIAGTVTTTFELDSLPRPPAVVWISGAADVSLRGVTVSGPGVGILADEAPRLRVERVRVSGATFYGVLASGPATELTVADSLVEGTIAGGPAGLWAGVAFRGGARGSLRTSAVVRNHIAGLVVRGADTTVDAAGVLVEDTLPDEADGTYGLGVLVGAGAQLSVADSAVVSNRMVGILVGEPGSVLAATAVLVADTLPDESDVSLGQGLAASGGGRISIAASVVVGNRDAAVWAFEPGTVLEANGTLFRASADGDCAARYVQGEVFVESGAHAVLSDNAVLIDCATGILVTGAGAALDARANLVQGLPGDESTDALAAGLFAVAGAAAAVEGNAFVSCRGLGLSSSGATLTATANLVEDTLPTSAGEEEGAGCGHGVELSYAAATLSGSAVLGSRCLGIAVTGPAADVTVSGNLVRGTLSRDGGGDLGWGVLVRQDARGTVSGNAVVENRRYGIAIQGAATVVDVARNLIEGTLPVDDAEGAEGYGVGLAEGARGTLAGNAVVANREAGLQVYGAGTAVVAAGNLIEGTLAGRAFDPELNWATGVVAHSGAELHLAGNVVLANHGLGLIADGAGTRVTAEGNLFQDTRPAPTGWYGIGAFFQEGAAAALSGNAVLGSPAWGLIANGAGTRLDLNGNLVELAAEDEEAAYPGVGVQFATGAAGSLSGDAVVASRQGALVVLSAGTAVTASASLFEETRPVDGPLGVGVAVVDGATAELTACVVRAHAAAAIKVYAATATIARSLLRGTATGRLPMADGGEVETGDGLLALEGSTVTVSGTVADGCARVGVLVDHGAGQITGSAVRGNRFGLVVQGSPGFVVGADVVVTGNPGGDRATDGLLPVPDEPFPVPPIPGLSVAE